jgi:hypothetical protein
MSRPLDNPLPPFLNVASSCHFAKLPLETIKQIVDEVHEQDKRWEEAVRESEADEDVLAERRKLPLWSGKGVLALSSVSRSFRAICLPILLHVRPSP